MKDNHRYKEAVKAGVKLPKDNYWGDVPSKICGEYGGATDDVNVEKDVQNFDNRHNDEEKSSNL